MIQIETERPVDRTDLVDICEKAAKEMGLKVSVNDEVDTETYKLEKGKVSPTNEYKRTIVTVIMDQTSEALFSINGKVKEKPTTFLYILPCSPGDARIEEVRNTVLPEFLNCMAKYLK